MITVPIVHVMKVTVHKVVNVVPVRNRLVTAPFPMLVAHLMSLALMATGALRRILCGNAQLVFVHMPRVEAVQVAIVQVIHMVTVPYSRVAAAFSMLVGMAFMNGMSVTHDSS
jgi:hypothetical protein